MVRQTHRLLWVRHGLFLYVDDGLSLFPLEAAPLLSALCVMFLVSLGIPLSWEKLQLGEDLSWIGWSLRLSARSACLPRDKQSKILGLLCPLLKAGTSMPRREVEREDLRDRAITCPRVRSGMIPVVFFDYSCASTRTCASSSFAVRLFHNAVAEEVRIPLCIKEAPPCLCAADAFAKGEIAG